MSEVMIPEDLAAFLDARHELVYDPATCEAGAVTLHPRERLVVRTFGACCGGTEHQDNDPDPRPGVYRVPGVDLIASCSGDYKPEGLLIWLPCEERYGTWDPDHDHIQVFGPEIGWNEIVTSPARFINAQWSFTSIDRAQAEILVPWLRHSKREPSG